MMDQRYLRIFEEVELTFNQLIYLILIYEENYEFLRFAHTSNFMSFNSDINRLEAAGLVKWAGPEIEDITLRRIAEDLFKKHVGTKKKVYTKKEVEQWIQSWREIFPEGTNSGGYRYRGDKAACIQKMIKFVNDHDYTVEQIFQATRDYVERFSLKGYMYMQLAHFFIHKQGVGSSLAAECEGLNERKPKEEGEEYGRSIV